MFSIGIADFDNFKFEKKNEIEVKYNEMKKEFFNSLRIDLIINI